MTDVPHTENYDEIAKHLGDVIPCYGRPVGCCASDWANEKWCDAETGCILLEVYKRGYRAARAAQQSPQQEKP